MQCLIDFTIFFWKWIFQRLRKEPKFEKIVFYAMKLPSNKQYDLKSLMKPWFLNIMQRRDDLWILTRISFNCLVEDLWVPAYFCPSMGFRQPNSWMANFTFDRKLNTGNSPHKRNNYQKVRRDDFHNFNGFKIVWHFSIFKGPIL